MIAVKLLHKGGEIIQNKGALHSIVITNHALQRFIERSSKLGIPTPKKANETILNLYKKAKPEDVDDVHKVLRLIKNKKEVIYKIYQGWRFVVSKEGDTILTVERIKQEQN